MRRAFTAVGHVLLAAVALVGKGLVALVRGFGTLLSRSRALFAVCMVVLVVLVGGLVDFGLNAGKAYPGVHVGEIDVAGKTTDEIEKLVGETYGSRLASNSVVIYASEDARTRAEDEVAQAQDAALAEQLAVEEARANKLAWTADAAALQARIPAEQMAAEALAVGRDNGGLFARVGTLFAGNVIEPRIDYSADSIELLASEIDTTIGDPRVDFDIAIEDGVASIIPGHDGYMIDRSWFKQSLNQVFLQEEAGTGAFVAQSDYAPLRIDETAAQSVANAVNQAIGDGVNFLYDGSMWNATATDIGAWVTTRVDEDDGGSHLVAYIDEDEAKPSLLSHLEEADQSESIRVTFEVDGQDATVLTDGTGKIPRAAEAVELLDAALFSEGGKAHGAGQAAPVEIAVETGEAPASLSFDEAMDIGVIGTIASFTTEFTTGAGTENRNHNITLASELLSNSVVKPDGTWSFNETAGECNAEHGFLDAGAIVGGEYDDAEGGGICQVATTVFNAVYDAGFPVITRHNHSLYISSYPTGRDAAVSWPDLDLVWENDSSSDVLVRLSCANGSVTATLYGVNPGYQVSTATGAWNEGEHYSTRTDIDPSLAPGTSYLKTRGTDGTTITVVRTVKDRSGAILHEDAFSSVYDPKTEVTVKGPDYVADTTG